MHHDMIVTVSVYFWSGGMFDLISIYGKKVNDDDDDDDDDK